MTMVAQTDNELLTFSGISFTTGPFTWPDESCSHIPILCLNFICMLHHRIPITAFKNNELNQAQPMTHLKILR